MSPILEVRDLVKRYGKVTAVDGLSFEIAQGSCFGLLGPNGAGKTTTMEIMEGLTEPCAGHVLFQGSPRDRQFRQRVGVQFQHTALMDRLSLRENLALFASFYPNSLPVEQLLAQCELEEVQHRTHQQVSGGQRQRLLLALALINNPSLVFLDEPTTGLDPQSRRRFWELIRRLKAEGKTVIMSTHYMDEAEALCDQLVIIDRGHVIAQGSPHALLKQHFNHVRVCLPPSDFAPVRHQLHETIVETDHEVEILTQHVEQTLQTLIQHQVRLNALRVRNPSLEDLFIKLTGHALRD